jgi:3-phenylpropionate/cinnamic acid dioxygenase small subunit
MSLSLEQKLAIHELLSRAAYAYDERDLDLLENSFDPDAVMSMRIAGGDLIGPFEGRDGILQLMKNSMAEQTDVRRHVVSNIFFESAGEPAVVISNLTLLSTQNGVASLLATGVYRDTVVEKDGSWRLLKRHLDLDSPY